MRREEGFSLIELMCAILILGVGLLGISQGITTALSSSKESERQTTAAMLAAGQIEMVRADGWIEPGESSGEFGEAMPQYRYRQSITRTKIDGLYEVEVTVESGEKNEAIYTLKTMLFDVPASASTSSSTSKKNDRNEGRKRRRDFQ